MSLVEYPLARCPIRVRNFCTNRTRLSYRCYCCYYSIYERECENRVLILLQKALTLKMMVLVGIGFDPTVQIELARVLYILEISQRDTPQTRGVHLQLKESMVGLYSDYRWPTLQQLRGLGCGWVYTARDILKHKSEYIYIYIYICVNQLMGRKEREKKEVYNIIENLINCDSL